MSPCGLYACDGVNTSCPTACDEDAGINTCVPVAQCDEVTCLPCWSGVQDGFDAGTRWVLAPLPATQYSEALIANGSLALTVQPRPQGPQLASATSVEASGLRECGVTFQLLTAAPRTNQYAARAQLFRDSPSQLPRYGWALDARGLVATWAFTDGGTGSQVIATDGGFTGWLRVEELAGEVRWRIAPPPRGSTFTTEHTLPHDGDLANLKLRFEASYPPQSSVNDRPTLQIDNLNLGP